MDDLGLATENQVILAWLQAEIESVAFQQYLAGDPPNPVYLASALRAARSPNLRDADQNELRRKIIVKTHVVEIRLRHQLEAADGLREQLALQFRRERGGVGAAIGNDLDPEIAHLIRRVLPPHDARGRVVSWNAGAERILGHRLDEIVGEHISRIFTDDDLQRGKPEYELKMAEAVGRFEDNGWRKRNDGSRFWANIVLTALRDQTGNLRGFAQVIRDISGSKRAEEALRASEERSRLISGLTSDYTYAFRIRPDGSMVREWVTDAFGRITGHAPEEFDARGWENLLLPEDRGIYAQRLEAMLAGRPDVREFRIVTKTGEIRWLHSLPAFQFGPLSVAGGVVFIGLIAGKLRAWRARDGEPVWESPPGSPIAGGPAIARGMVFVGSGAGEFLPGNRLRAFALPA